MGLVDGTMWGLQFFLWSSPKPTVTISCSVLSFPVWPEAWAGGLRDLWLQLCALWFDHHCGDREPAGIMALLLHLWRKFPMPLGTRSLDRVSPSIVLRPLHQVTQSSPSLTLHTNAWPVDWWNHQELHVGWTWPWGQCCCRRDCSIVDSSQPAYQSVCCLFKCSRERLKNLPGKQPALFLLRF